MKTLKELAREVGATIHTSHLMSSPPQVRLYFEFNEAQLEELADLILLNRNKGTQFKLDFEK